MNTLLRLVSFVLASSIFVFGCSGSDGAPGQNGINGHDGDDGKDGQDGEDGAPGKNGTAGKDACDAPAPEFYMILRDYDEAKAYYWACQAQASADESLCMHDATAPTEVMTCQNNVNEASKSCNEYYVWRVNKTAGRLCGAEILHFDGFQAVGVVTDTDGDGLQNYMEFELFLNPCSKQSYGSCVNDADLDGDLDGIPNGTDPYPYCNLEDPKNVSDCILYPRITHFPRHEAGLLSRVTLSNSWKAERRPNYLVRLFLFLKQQKLLRSRHPLNLRFTFSNLCITG